MDVPVFDEHNDVLLEQRSFAERSDAGHLDLAVMHLEGAEAIEPDLAGLPALHALGWDEPALRLAAHANFMRVLAAALAA